MRRLQRLPFDLIQEWDIEKEPFEYIEIPVSGERLVHAVSDLSREIAVCVTESMIFTVNFESAAVATVGKISGNMPARGRVAALPGGSVIGPDDGNSLWKFEPKKFEFERNAIALPESFAGIERLYWTRYMAGGAVYTSDREGNIFALREKAGFTGPLAKAPYCPVGPSAATFDGRIFGFSGNEMSRMFCFEPESSSMSDIGVAVSTFERRRYGYSFGDAVTGRDGQIIFGEDDDLGHLWLYFPRIKGMWIEGRKTGECR